VEVADIIIYVALRERLVDERDKDRNIILIYFSLYHCYLGLISSIQIPHLMHFTLKFFWLLY